MTNNQTTNKLTKHQALTNETIYCIVYDMQNAKRMRCFSSMYAVAFVYVVEERKCRCEDAMQRKINPNAEADDETQEAKL